MIQQYWETKTLELWPGGQHRALYYRLSAAASSINNTQLIIHKQPVLWNAWTSEWAIWDVPALFVKVGIKHTQVEIEVWPKEQIQNGGIQNQKPL